MQFKHSIVALGAIGTLMLFGGQPVEAQSTDTEKKEKPSTSETKKDKKKIVTIKSGDTLEKIAKKNKTTYVRIFNANTEIDHPDRIDVGEKVRIPTNNEKLKDRFSKLRAPAPIAPVAPTQQAPVAYEQPAQSVGASSVARGSSAGNTYYKGYCTWHVKNMRPDLPNMLGDGGSWVANAAAQGIPTGSEPRVGAVAEEPGHVAYVTAVNGNTVTVSEMNYVGFGVQSTRTAPASSFTYIY